MEIPILFGNVPHSSTLFMLFDGLVSINSYITSTGFSIWKSLIQPLFFLIVTAVFNHFCSVFSAKTWALWDKAQRKQLLKWRLTLAEQVNSFSTNLWRKYKMRCIGFFWALHNAYNKFTFLCRNFLFFWGAYNSKQHNTTLPYKMRLINKIIIAMCPLCRGLAQGWNSTSKLHSLAMLLGKKGISRLP